jgi:hypothetical protein
MEYGVPWREIDFYVAAEEPSPFLRRELAQSNASRRGKN